MKVRTIAVALAALMIAQFSIVGCNKNTTDADKDSRPFAGRKSIDRKELTESFAKSKNDIIAKVNGEPITMFILLRKMNTIAPEYMGPNKSLPPETQRKMEKDALNMLIFQVLAVQEAKKRGMKVDSKELDAAVESMKSKLGSEKAFQEYMDSIGMNQNEVRETIERERLYAMIVSEIGFENIAISEKALKERYEKDKALFVTKGKNPRQAGFKEVKGAIEQKMRAEEGRRKIGEWEQELRRNAVIEIAS